MSLTRTQRHQGRAGNAERYLLFGLLALLLTGCVSTAEQPARVARAEVGVSLIAPQSEGATTLASGQSASGGRPLEAATVMPEYPRQWLPRGLPPLTIDALVIVDRTGAIERIDIDSSSALAVCAACLDDFSDSVRSALRQWSFAPLEIADWIDGPDLDADGEPDTVTRGVVASLPYSLRLRFAFSVRDGVAVVDQAKLD